MTFSKTEFSFLSIKNPLLKELDYNMEAYSAVG